MKTTIRLAKNLTDATINQIFIGVDCGLANPGFSILREDKSHLMTCHIENKDKGLTYKRANEIAVEMIDVIDNQDKPSFHDICLIIEGSSFTKNSQSLEQLANCRQAIYDAFHFLMPAVYCIVIPPYDAKRLTTGNKSASKIEVYNWAKKNYPEVFKGLGKAYRKISKGKNKGKLVLNKKVENMSDSLAIAYSGIEKWKLNPKMYEV